jgi:hypothetical protein
MPPLRCPTCDRALQLRDEQRGALVQCPLCRTTFQAPAAAEGLYIPDAPSLEPFRPQPSPGAAPLPPLNPPQPSVSLPTPEDLASLESAVHWLRGALLAYVFTSLWCWAYIGRHTGEVGMLLIVMTRWVPALLSWLTSLALRARRYRAFCVFTSVCLCLVSVAEVLECLALAILTMPGQRGSVSAWEQGIGIVFSLIVGFVGFMAVSRLLAVLGNPRIRAAFR